MKNVWNIHVGLSDENLWQMWTARHQPITLLSWEFIGPWNIFGIHVDTYIYNIWSSTSSYIFKVNHKKEATTEYSLFRRHIWSYNYVLKWNIASVALKIRTQTIIWLCSCYYCHHCYKNLHPWFRYKTPTQNIIEKNIIAGFGWFTSFFGFTVQSEQIRKVAHGFFIAFKTYFLSAFFPNLVLHCSLWLILWILLKIPRNIIDLLTGKMSTRRSF